MRKIIATFFALAVFITAKAELDGKQMPTFMVLNTLTDNTLKTTEAKFQFNFIDMYQTKIVNEIRMSYNSKEITIKPNKLGAYDLILKLGKYKFQFYAGESYREVYTDSVVIKSKEKKICRVAFPSGQMIMAEKPVIYCYSPITQKVEIKLNPLGNFKFTYPAYKNSWNFEANPNGDLKFADKTYNYLFWDASIDLQGESIDFMEGYQVDKDSLLSFFEEKLTAMNLSSKEIQDYITYWVPQMSESKQYYIHFLFNEEFDKYAPLDINPKPDNLFRVFMVMKPIDSKQDLHLKPQTIQKVNRKGFTVVEWGGTQINKKTNIVN